MIIKVEPIAATRKGGYASAAVGLALAGAPGLIAGAVLGRKDSHLVLVTHKDGRQEARRVTEGELKRLVAEAADNVRTGGKMAPADMAALVLALGFVAAILFAFIVH